MPWKQDFEGALRIQTVTNEEEIEFVVGPINQTEFVVGQINQTHGKIAHKEIACKMFHSSLQRMTSSRMSFSPVTHSSCFSRSCQPPLYPHYFFALIKMNSILSNMIIEVCQCGKIVSKCHDLLQTGNNDSNTLFNLVLQRPV